MTSIKPRQNHVCAQSAVSGLNYQRLFFNSPCVFNPSWSSHPGKTKRPIHACDTMEPDREDKPENERPLLVLENSKKKSSLLVTDESQVPFNKAASYPFKKWMDSFRVKKHQTLPLSERFVEGWFDQSQADNNSNNNLFPNHAVQDQQWERLSGHSSQLGTVKTATMSIASQSIVRSRGNTQSTTNQSAGTDTRMSMDSMRTTLSPPLDEAAQSRALKRRQVLQEIVTTESDYVLGLKALSDVCPILYTTSLHH